MGEFDLKDYVKNEFDSVWKAIDKIREELSCLSNNFSGLSTETKIEISYIKKTVDDINLNVKDLKISLENKIETLNKASQELDKQPLKEKAKLFDTTIGVIIKSVVPWIIAAIAILYNKVKGG